MTEEKTGTGLRRWIVDVVFGWEVFRVLAGSLSELFTAGNRAAASDRQESSRAADLATYPGSVFHKRERWGTLFVLLSSAVAVCGGLIFLFAYWAANSTFWMGGGLALFCGATGCTLVLWSHWLMRERQATEPREQLPSPPPVREAISQTFHESKQEVSRRRLLTALGTLAIGFVAAIGVSLLRSLGMFPESEIFDTVYHRGQRLVTIDGRLITDSSLEIGSTAVVFPEDKVGDERAQTVLVRVQPEFLNMPDGRNAWAPMGYVAYSRVCTHAGCPVGMYEATNCTLLCPCHQSTFDVLRAAQPTGGPAARPLPQLPLYVDGDGTLRAGGGFTEPPGPGFWSIRA